MSVMTVPSERLPALYLSHGAPPLIDDPVWTRELAAWGGELAHPKAILVVSAHWESAPLTIGATTRVPLVYDFYGFPDRYYTITYPSPGAPDVAEQVRRLVTDLTPTAEDPQRGLDHGAYMPLLFMYPDADVPCWTIAARRPVWVSPTARWTTSCRCSWRWGPAWSRVPTPQPPSTATGSTTRSGPSSCADCKAHIVGSVYRRAGVPHLKRSRLRA